MEPFLGFRVYFLKTLNPKQSFTRTAEMSKDTNQNIFPRIAVICIVV
jgi:hypothetical protein